MAKGIFIAENMASTTVGSLLRSAVQDANIENGSVVVLENLVDGEDALYEAGAVANIKDTIYFVDGVELDASEEIIKGLDDFENVAGKPFRVRKPLVGDIFSISESMITPLNASTGVVKGNLVETVANGATKIKEKASTFTENVSFGGVILAKWTFGTRAIPMVRIEVTKVV